MAKVEKDSQAEKQKVEDLKGSIVEIKADHHQALEKVRSEVASANEKCMQLQEQVQLKEAEKEDVRAEVQKEQGLKRNKCCGKSSTKLLRAGGAAPD